MLDKVLNLVGITVSQVKHMLKPDPWQVRQVGWQISQYLVVGLGPYGTGQGSTQS
jgi:hypothetical protein